MARSVARRRILRGGAALAALAGLVLADAPARAELLVGDLDGDGAVGASDESLLPTYYGAVEGDAGSYDAAADWNADGAIDYRDVAAVGSNWGASGGPVDATPPSLLVTLDDIPDDMNDLVVVPPQLFQITLHLDSAGGSVVDMGSLSVTSSEDMGAFPAGTELAGQFTVTPTRAVWEVPAGSDLPRTSHYLTVSLRDAAGNETSDVYGYAVRDFTFANDPPLGDLNTFYVQFRDPDFAEDLREFGLSSTNGDGPALEPMMEAWLVTEIIERMHPFYGRNPDGSPGVDPVNVVFTSDEPAGTYQKICVGGEVAGQPTLLGAATMDVNNYDENQIECSATKGVFPRAMGNLWGGNAEFQSTFHPLDPDFGGVPVGEDPLDVVVLDAQWDPGTASAAELSRRALIDNAVDGLAQSVAGLTAHEVGHMLGLVAHDPLPQGLFGGDVGANTDHNVTASGQTPTATYLMNAGGTFTFQEIAGRGGEPIPVFREVAWAYLHDRVALNANVTELLPAPELLAVVPDTVNLIPLGAAVPITLEGAGFVATPTVKVRRVGTGTEKTLNGISFLDPNTIEALVSPFVVTPPDGVYDVIVMNPDEQEVVLEAALTVDYP